MIEKKKSRTIEELQRLQYLATKCSCDVGLHSLDGSIIVDARSYIGTYVLGFREPILAVSKSKEFLDVVKGISETLGQAG